MAPASWTCIAPQPEPYFSSVIGPFARSQEGSRNHARGDASMNNALISISNPTIAAMILPIICMVSTHSDIYKSCVRHFPRQEYECQQTARLLGDRFREIS